MTHAECVAALQRYDRRAVILALVAQIRPDVLAHCRPEDREVCTRALDTAQAWALGRATREECRKAADDAYAASSYAPLSAAAYAATATAAASSYADTAHAADASLAVSAAYSAATEAARQRLVDALTHAPASGAAQWLVAGEYVLAGASVWTGSAWVPFGAAPADVLVTLDGALEAA